MTGGVSKLLKQTVTVPPTRKYITLAKCTARFKETESFLTAIRKQERERGAYVKGRSYVGNGKEGKKAEVSNGNKSSNAEQFLPALSRSADPISNLKTGLCLVTLAVGRQVQPSEHPLPHFPLLCARPQRCSLSSELSSTALLEDTSQQQHTLWPQLDLKSPTCFHKAEKNR